MTNYIVKVVVRKDVSFIYIYIYNNYYYYIIIYSKIRYFLFHNVVNVELPEPGFSPQATRRISSGSLLKASEVVSLATAARDSNVNFRNERAKSIDKTEGVKKLPIINPLVRLPMWPSKSRMQCCNLINYKDKIPINFNQTLIIKIEF